jgi:hypothetical protein
MAAGACALASAADDGAESGAAFRLESIDVSDA